MKKADRGTEGPGIARYDSTSPPCGDFPSCPTSLGLDTCELVL